MQHLTLTTGDCRWSPRAEVGDDVIPVLLDHLALALRGLAPVPGQPGYTLRAVQEANVLIGTIERDGIPIVTLAVVPADVDVQAIVGLMGPPATRQIPTPGPWCLVRLYDTAVLAPLGDLAWMGDYERCVAWAWLDESGVTRQQGRH